jgi:hypothetical protein
MSTKLGMAKLYIHSEDFAKILKLEDENNLEVVKIKKNDADKTIEFRIVTPVDNTTSDMINAYNSHWDIKRRYITVKDGSESYIAIDLDKLNNYSNEKLGEFIKENYKYWKENLNNNDEIIFKVVDKI